eukprot:6485677-Amphidinium_carterae.1
MAGLYFAAQLSDDYEAKPQMRYGFAKHLRSLLGTWELACSGASAGCLVCQVSTPANFGTASSARRAST